MRQNISELSDPKKRGKTGSLNFFCPFFYFLYQPLEYHGAVISNTGTVTRVSKGDMFKLHLLYDSCVFFFCLH